MYSHNIEYKYLNYHLCLHRYYNYFQYFHYEKQQFINTDFKIINSWGLGFFIYLGTSTYILLIISYQNRHFKTKSKNLIIINTTIRSLYIV